MVSCFTHDAVPYSVSPDSLKFKRPPAPFGVEEGRHGADESLIGVVLGVS